MPTAAQASRDVAGHVDVGAREGVVSPEGLVGGGG
jgi:hypothetical protein